MGIVAAALSVRHLCRCWQVPVRGGILNLFHDGHAILQKLRAGNDEVVAGFHAVQNDVIVADGVADGQAFLTRDGGCALFHGQENEKASIDSNYR